MEHETMRWWWSRKPSHKFNTMTVIVVFFLFFSRGVFSTDAVNDASNNITIPCVNSTDDNTPQPFVQSHSNYTLINCTSDLIFIDLAANTTAPSSSTTFGVLENVTICVLGGTVLPRLYFSSTTMMQNVNIFVVGVNVTNGLISPGASQSSSSPVMSIVDISGSSGNIVSIRNIAITIEKSELTLKANATAGGGIVVSPLMYLVSTAKDVVISGVSLTILDSHISLHVNISELAGTVEHNIVALAAVGLPSLGSMGHLRLVVMSSSLTLSMIATEPTLGKYVDTDPTIFYVRAVNNELSYLSPNAIATNLTDAVFTFSNASSFNVSVVVPGTNDAASVLSIRFFSVVENILVTVQNKTKMSVECVCGGSTCAAVQERYPSARIVETSFAATMTGITLNAQHATFMLNTPRLALAFTWQNALILRNVTLMVADCSFSAVSVHLNVNLASRTQSLIDISSNDHATAVFVLVANSTIDFRIESGACKVAIGAVVGLLDNVSFSSVQVDNVTVTSSLIDGTAIVVNNTFITMLTMLTTIVNLAMQFPAYANTGQHIQINVRHSSVDATHSTKINESAVTFLAIVVSLVSVVNIVRNMSDSTVYVEAVHVRQLFPPAASSLQGIPPVNPGNVLWNITTLANYFDATSTVLDTLNLAPQIVEEFLGGTPPTAGHTNMTTTIAGNSSVTWAPTIISSSSSSSDHVALVTLPGVSIGASFQLSRSSTIGGASSKYGIGSVLASIGKVTLRNSVVNASEISGVAMLLFVSVDALTLDGDDTALRFQKIELQRSAQDGQQFALRASDTTTIFVSPFGSTTLVPLLFIQQCTFQGFHALLMPKAFTLLHSGSASVHTGVQNKLLELGCNAWDGVGLPAALVTSNKSLLPLIKYPWGLFNTSILCHGFQNWTSSKSLSSTMMLPIAAVAPPLVPPITVSTVTSIAGVVGAAAAASSAMMDAQSLVALGRSVCAPQALHEATSASQFLLSPFYSLGDYAMVFGNLGLFLMFHVVHRLLLWRRACGRHQVPPALLSSFSAPSIPEGRNSLLPRGGGAYSSPESEMRFPNLSIIVGMVLAPGVVNGGVRGLLSGDILETVAGIVALCVSAVGIWTRVRTGRSRGVQRMRFIHWPHHVRQSFIAPWLLPYGQWGPLELRSMYGALRGAVRVGCEWLSAQTITAGLLVQAVASIPVPTSWCVGLWFVLCGIQLVSVVLTVVVRPARAPATDIVQVLGLLITVALQAVAGLLSLEVLSDSSSSISSSMIVVLSLLTMIVSVVKAAHSGLILWWESRQKLVAASSTQSAARHLDNDLQGRLNDSLGLGAIEYEQQLLPALFLSLPPDFDSVQFAPLGRRGDVTQSAAETTMRATTQAALMQLISTICDVELSG
ncbi:membrane-associated protein, putative [Bodo saltans]|uniref:Membrane-associated protein, putative n=1 Tax=Bodo saltans TaxID=75058 RepID=A0A0S4J2P5_BODSA|nr:membrane-associated protein, putative [Bodo saltans]|eukprot:CUG47331.1 membrane-associated protein, putative [Bodo saltans]